MINLILKGHSFENEVQTAVQIFYHNTKYCVCDSIQQKGLTVYSSAEKYNVSAEMYIDGILKGSSDIKCQYELLELSEKKRIVKRAIYNMLKDITGYKPSWGVMTGIRPTKMVNELYYKGFDEESIYKYILNNYDVDDDRIKLALYVANTERLLLSNNTPECASLYIGIPFCPSRCLYCSFTSYDISVYKNKVERYIDTLIKELKFLSKQRFDIKTIYIGGGTPVSLNEYQLEKLLFNIQDIFDMPKITEYTVEAGRPDALNIEKLNIIKKYGASRISINPQTMNDKTLEIIGRKHNSEQTRKAFYNAREAGHENINMDLILGLPNEKVDDVEYTFNEIKKLSPDNITVHTLAVKRASKLNEYLTDFSNIIADIDDMKKMISVSSSCAKDMGMKPYYMYRQKNSAGNFENVGYCTTGKENVYNIQIMEEKQTILAAGAGATSKFYYANDNRIERAFNIKDVDGYISRIDEMIERKKEKLNKF